MDIEKEIANVFSAVEAGPWFASVRGGPCFHPLDPKTHACLSTLSLLVRSLILTR